MNSCYCFFWGVVRHVLLFIQRQEFELEREGLCFFFNVFFETLSEMFLQIIQRQEFELQREGLWLIVGV